MSVRPAVQAGARVAWAALAALALAMPAQHAGAADGDDPTATAAIQGRWHGVARFPDWEQCWLTEMDASGDIRVQFMARALGAQVVRRTEEGRWAYSNGLLTTVIQRISGVPVTARDLSDFIHVYRVDLLTAEQASMFHFIAGVHFNQSRVPADFRMSEDCLERDMPGPSTDGERQRMLSQIGGH